MSTNDYLSTLSIVQLRYARDKAQDMINEIEAEKKIKLWVVSGVHVNEACFKDDDFNAAKVKLCEEIMGDDFTPQEVRHDHPKIQRKVVFESEVEEWMSLNR